MIRTILFLGAIASPCLAAAQRNSFMTVAPMPIITLQRQALTPPPAAKPGFTAAPTPNQDASLVQPKASNAPYVAPNLFTRKDQYRGEGISPSASAQSEQDRRVRPGAGFSLNMPLQ